MTGENGRPATMRAALLLAAGRMEVREIPVPEPAEGEVLLRITGAGLCGSDAALFTQGMAAFPPDRRGELPLVISHEFAGEVVELGRSVDGLHLGEVVACGAGISCGACRACTAGRTNLCEEYRTLGAHFNGGLAQYCAVPASVCVPASPLGASGDDVALAQPMAVASHALSRAHVTAADRVLVIGCGGIGAFAVWAAKSLGVHVSATDLRPDRLGVAAALGADWTFDGSTTSVQQAVAQGWGWNVVIETTGAQSALDLAISGARPGARIVQLGLHHQPRALPLKSLTLNEVDIIASYAHVCAQDLPRALSLLATRPQGWADIAPTVSTLSDVVEDALVPLATGDAGRIKALVDPFAVSTRPYSREKGDQS
ncbi:Zn-dependent oxidoreductase [Amycolatopsis ultiminotia]|uniref:Zn-dependent oxidoreductase n=1 Tax=Amycolatopsis ultiminotia TaxID=543629 RepID=A0ABP6XJI8_9PSEU